MATQVRNIAIIAHVDHGKTTLVDRILEQSGTFAAHTQHDARVMDSNDLEKERGITILAKNTAVDWKGTRINIVDTPGHADFGGEVERVLSMVDSVLLLVDAADGPMPQTRFVTKKAFEAGLRPIVVINKIDRPGARPDWVIDQVFDLFCNLGATEEQLDFPVIYASALLGTATLDLNEPKQNLDELLDAVVRFVPPPEVEVDAPFQMQISVLDYSTYVGTIGIGRIRRGRVAPNMQVSVIDKEGKVRQAKILQVLSYKGLDRYESPEAFAGDIVAITGIEDLYISDTICDKQNVEALPALTVDEPTVSIVMCVNDSPFAGKEGKYLTSRQLSDRLARECIHNVALRVTQPESPDKFLVAGRGELHLGILLENMRREGFEMAVSRPQVITHIKDGVEEEPYEELTIDVEEAHQGGLMQLLGERQADLVNMVPDGTGRVRLDYIIPARGLLSFRHQFMTMTSGTGIATHVFSHYAPAKSKDMEIRRQGVLISNALGVATAYSLFNIQPRGRLMIGPQTKVYEGMIVGLHTRDNDLVVNVTKGKQLTNMRASGTDENIVLTPPLKFTLETAMEMIDEDELVEITPTSIRLRKKQLNESLRKKK